MSAPLNEVQAWFGLQPHNQPPKVDFTARPCGEIDYDALCDDVSRTYPKVLARLAE